MLRVVAVLLFFRIHVSLIPSVVAISRTSSPAGTPSPSTTLSPSGWTSAPTTVCYTDYSTSSACDASTSTAPFCRWCSATGTCLQNTTTCLTNCGSTTDSAVCGGSSQCSWCSALGICLPKTGSGSTCYATCNAASTAGSSFCAAASPTCLWCSALGICNSVAQTCYSSCTAASISGSTYCQYSQSACKWCSAIGICQAQSLTCYASCMASTTQGSSFCALTTSCSYCSAIGLCQAKTGATCYSTCLATDATSCAASTLCLYCSVMGICRALGSACYTSCQAASTEGSTVCSSTSNCHWCSAISICQVSSLTCFTSCAATTATQDSTFCNFAQSCTYCTAIQLCQTDGSTCYATCQAASVDNAACDASVSCQYCSILGVCLASAATCQPVEGILPRTNMRERGQQTLNSNEYMFQSSFTDGTYLYFVADTLTGYGKMVRVNPTTFTRSVSVTGSTTGTNYWRCVAQSGGYAYVGTFEAPANLLQITLATMTIANTLSLSSYSLNCATTVQIVGSYAYFATYESSPSIVRIAIPGFTYSTSTTISSSYCQRITSSGQYGGYLFFTCNMAPGRLMRFDYASMAYSTYISGNSGDNNFIAMAISGSTAYVSCGTAPGRLIQFNLASMTYGSVVSGATGEDDFISVYVSGTFVYVTTGTSPSRIVRFYTTTMVRLFAVSGNPLNDWSLTAPVAFGAYVYYGTSSSSINPGVISRFNFGVTNSPSASPSLSSDDTLTLSRGISSGSGSLDATHPFSPSLSLSRSRSLGWTSSNAVVPFPNPGTTMRRSSQLLLRLNDVSFQSGFTDGTYLYFVSNSAYGQMVRIDPVTFTRVDAVNGSSTGTNNWYCVASSGGYAYVGTTESTNARILRIKLSSMTVTGTLTLTGHGLIITAELVGDFVVFATDETIPFIATVNINNANFFVSRTTTVSSVFCQLIRASGQYGGYIFFACQMFPGRLMRFDYTNMAYSGYVAGNVGDNTFYAMAIVGSLAYVACGVNPGRLVKFNLATMAYIAGVSGVTGENYFLSVFVQGAYVYTTTNTSPSRIVRFDPKTMTRMFAVSGNPLTDSALLAPVQLGAYVYYASASSNPGVVSRFRLDVTLTATPSRSLGWTSSNAIVPFPNPGTTVRRSSQLLLNSSEIGFQSGFTDGTYLYYVANAAYGQMVRIDPVTFTRVDAVSGSSTGTNNWYCVA
ncbi:Hypothetical protein, putative, partial [Bodo saltans]